MNNERKVAMFATRRHKNDASLNYQWHSVFRNAKRKANNILKVFTTTSCSRRSIEPTQIDA